VKVLIYVEGPSDRAALEALLRPIMDAGRSQRVGISFLPLRGKDAVLRDAPRKAAGYLHDSPNDWVFALPDLYPMARYDGSVDQHRSHGELAQLLHRRFEAEASALRLPEPVRRRFRAHCLKHDLEALLLAATDELRARLKTQNAFKGHWRLPVEDQNDNRPPKRVVEELFNQYCKKGYDETNDAPWILTRASASLDKVLKACPQCFAPFVRELKELADGRDPDIST